MNETVLILDIIKFSSYEIWNFPRNIYSVMMLYEFPTRVQRKSFKGNPHEKVYDEKVKRFEKNLRVRPEGDS